MSLQVYPASQRLSTLRAALAWLDLGAALVPCQPSRKNHVAGFGFYNRRITTPDEARFWFCDRSSNLAVITGTGDVLALDFDSWDAFAAFSRENPDLCETLTEQSRRGVHLYYQVAGAPHVKSGDASGGLFEVKAAGAAILAAPSIVACVRYTTITPPPILRCDELPARLHLSFLSESKPISNLEGKAGDLVSRCKRALDVLELSKDLQRLRGIRATWNHSKDGTWWRSCCPFHGPERHPSFMVNVAKGFYLCKACQARGDGLNLYQAVHGLPDVQSAILEVARRLP